MVFNNPGLYYDLLDDCRDKVFDSLRLHWSSSKQLGVTKASLYVSLICLSHK